jgi:hypothetical protein
MLTERELYNLNVLIEEHNFKLSDKLFRLVKAAYESGKSKARRSSIGYGVILERKHNKYLKDHRA